MPGRKVSHEDMASIGGAFISFLDTIVQISLERVEAERAATGGDTGPGAFTRQQAADYLAISKGSLDRLKHQRVLKPVEVAGMPRYTRSSLDRYLSLQERKE